MHRHTRQAAQGAGPTVERPKDVTQLWQGYDPTALPLDVKIEKEWVEDGVRFQKVYFTSEVWEGEPVRVFAYTGVPVGARKVPGVLHIHGGGQTAYLEWVKFWTKRGYGAVSLDWCGKYGSRTDYTRWGKAKANMMTDGQARTTEPSVRYSPWYHWAVASRRALTLLERLPGVDTSRLGVFGVSMGGTLTWMVAGCDRRVKAAAPIYGGGWNTYAQVVNRASYTFPVPPDIDLWRATMEPETYARYAVCPVLLLSCTNDFFTHMDRAYDSVARVPAETRQSFTFRYNHHLEPAQGRTLALWMDRFLKGGAPWAASPRVSLTVVNGQTQAVVTPDQPDRVTAVDVVYSVGEKIPQARYWQTTETTREGANWRAVLPLLDTKQPLRAVCNVTYRDGYTLSSNEAVAVPASLGATVTSEKPSRVIDDFAKGIDAWSEDPAYTDPWQDVTYLRPTSGPEGGSALTLNPAVWGSGNITYSLGTHKVGDLRWMAPRGASLSFFYRGKAPATLEVHAWVNHWGDGMKEYVAKVPLGSPDEWRQVTVTAEQCVASDGAKLPDWRDVDRLNFVGSSPAGQPPAFARVEWVDSIVKERSR